MANDLHGVVKLDSNGRVVIDPETLDTSEMQRLADQDHVVSLRSYLSLHLKQNTLIRDLDALRVSFRLVSDRCAQLERSQRPDERLFTALRELEDRVQRMDRELSEYMLQLHDEERKGICLYDFCWMVINNLQGSIEQMNNCYYLDVLEGFERIEI